MRRIRINLGNPDHCFNIVLVFCAPPLIAIVLIGMLGSGA